MQKGNIGVTTENIFPVIKKFLYSDHEIFIREIVSNAVDATQKLKTLAGKGDFQGEMGELKDFPEDQTPMWTDFFAYTAKNNLKSIKSGVAEAKKLGLELDEDDLKSVQSNIDSTKSNAESSGYSLSAYLRAYYGKGLSEKLFRSILEEQQLYSKLNDTKEKELKDALSKEDVQKAFDDGLTTYAVASFRSYNVNAETTVNEEDGSEAVTDETISNSLYTSNMPDPDILIRTGGEQRISNFLLWQLAYTELFFLPVMWPDFTGAHLREVIDRFLSRERRFGKTSEQVQN